MNRFLPLLAAGFCVALGACSNPSPRVSQPDRPLFTPTGPEAATTISEARRLALEQDFPAANKAFERYIAAHPADAQGPLFYGFSLHSQSEATDEPSEARRVRLKARQQLVAAQKLGATDPLMTDLLKSIPADGAPIAKPPLANDRAVATLMADAEKAYARGDYLKAAQLHQEALEADPKNYPAALFCGDAYFGAKIYDLAAKWFAKAVAINPDIETAHRYWADALEHQGKYPDATREYVEAVVAEPYNGMTRERFKEYKERCRPALKGATMRLPSAGVVLKNGKVEIQVNGKDDPFAIALGLCYASACANVRSKDFSKLYPGENKPRRSLPEEVAGLRAMNRMATEIAAAKTEPANSDEKAKWQPALNTLAQIERDGLLEAYALLERPDQDLARDYVAYRAAHRDLLVRFVRRYWCGLD